MTFETKRLILRPWEVSDAEDLYRYASDPAVGPIAGWPAHTSVENSRGIIRDVLSAPETYATVLKEEGRAVGSIGLTLGKASNIGIPETEGEIGFWIGVPFWGRGLIPEATREIMRHGFEDLCLERLWCGYYDGNEKSRRVQEKCGFRYHHTTEDVFCQVDGLLRTEHVTCISREEWGVSGPRQKSTIVSRGDASHPWESPRIPDYPNACAPMQSPPVRLTYTQGEAPQTG